jgi:hypothetical protein
MQQFLIPNHLIGQCCSLYLNVYSSKHFLFISHVCNLIHELNLLSHGCKVIRPRYLLQKTIVCVRTLQQLLISYHIHVRHYFKHLMLPSISGEEVLAGPVAG